MRIPFIAGNWKMFKTQKEAQEFAEEFKTLYGGTDVRAAICGPYLDLPLLVESFKGTGIKVGAQNVHYAPEGAYTGEVLFAMLDEIEGDYCIVGHSERRQYFGETDESVNKKLHALFASTILPILCVGEVLEERDAGKALEIVENQLTKDLADLSPEQVSSLTIAYEPVWAIGTGRNATPEQADEMCGFIRDMIEKLYDETVCDRVVIQYGGSVKPSNSTDLMNMPEIDGALVGGASLKPRDFMDIIEF